MMVPVKRQVCVNGKSLGWFVRDENGDCKIVGGGDLSQVERKLLNLCFEVLKHSVCRNGHFPSEEQMHANAVRLAVPTYVIGPLFAHSNESLARLLGVPPSLVMTRREQILAYQGHGRIPINILGGGDA
jgi:hypothetical protein